MVSTIDTCENYSQKNTFLFYKFSCRIFQGFKNDVYKLLHFATYLQYLHSHPSKHCWINSEEVETASHHPSTNYTLEHANLT